MKKFVALLMVLIMVFGFSLDAMAASDNEKSILFIKLLLLDLSSKKGSDSLIDFNKSTAYEDDDGDVVVVIELMVPRYLFTLDWEASVRLASIMWKGLRNVHELASQSSIYLLIKFRDDNIYFVAWDGVYDIEMGVTLPHPPSDV